MIRPYLLLICLMLGTRVLAAQNVAEVQVTPETITLRVGQKQALFAAAFDASGNLIPTARFTFKSNNPTVAEAQADGAVIGLKAGAAIVEVRAGQKRFNVAVSVESGAQTPEQRAQPASAPSAPPVTGPPPTVLAIEPTPIYLLPSENRRLIARAFRDDGSPADLPRVTWKSLTPEIAAVDADGVVVGLAVGTAIVQASIPGGLAATSPVEVVATEFSVNAGRLVMAPSDLDTLFATIAVQGNRELRNGLQWRSSAPEIVRVGPTGIVQALAPGEAEITVSGFFQERRIPVRVHPPVQTLVVTPKPGAGLIRMPLKGTKSITVRAEAADSTPVPEASLWWELGDTSIVTFDAARSEVTAKGLGTTTVTLRVRGFDPISWVIEVIPGGIALERARYPLLLGDRLALKPNLVDESGASLALATELAWVSDNTNVAVVGNDGVVEATGFGRARLTATTKWGTSTTADIFVLGELVFSANRGGSIFGLFQVASRDPSRVVPVLADSFQNLQPAVSPDRLTIAFSSNRGGDFDLYLMDADGDNLRQLTTQAGADGEPTWSPDGSRILFSSAQAGATQIFSINADGSNLHQITTSGGGNFAPTISPDGKTISFVSGRDGNDEIYRMDLDGANQINLSLTREKESSPRFFPTGALAWSAEVKRGGWQIVRRGVGDSIMAVLVTDPNPITSFGVSRDGQRLAVVAGKVTDPRRGRAEFTFSLHNLGGGVPFQIPLILNEQVVRPGF